MCGIVGYIGSKNAVPFLMEGLSRLEYRGYDSAGVATVDQGQLHVEKSMGRLANLEKCLQKKPCIGTLGIGHTRWATHGEPSARNAHPHLNQAGTIAVVHNGIIENYKELREELEAAGCVFLSQTDTEVIPHLIDRQIQSGASRLDAIRVSLSRARGAYALGIVFADEPDRLYAARLGSPLIVGVGSEGLFIASDVPAVLNQVEEVVYLNDGEIASLGRDGSLQLIRLDGQSVEADRRPVELEAEAAEKAGFETFMLKEIHEQPRVLRGLLREHVDLKEGIHFPKLSLDDGVLEKLERVMIVSCGTAYYAGFYGRLLLEHLTGIAAEIDLASEFRYRSPKFSSETLVIAVSQSGETADTLASIRMAKERGCKVLSICNVEGSSLARESDGVIYTQAGPEIGVASTKAYTSQLMVFALFALHLARLRKEIPADRLDRMLDHLHAVPDAIHYVLDRKELIEKVADKHHDGPSALYLGRRFNYPTAMEGALKNKEISYQHAEAYAAGEMKHGPIALINEYLPVICVCTRTDDEIYEKMISNVKEVEARHGRIIAVATDGDEQVKEFAEDIIYVPQTCEEISPMVNVVALQLLAYYSAQARGTDIDKPRNLAKSVTVE